MLSNNPIWIEINFKSEETGELYTGKFGIKPFLTIRDKTEVSKIYGKYSAGVPKDADGTLWFLNTLAFFKLAIVESDCEWWSGDEPGMDLPEEGPVYALLDAYSKAKAEMMPKKDVK